MRGAWNQAERKEDCPQQNNRALHRLHRLHLLISNGVKEDPSKVITIANLTKAANGRGIRRIARMTS